MSKIYMRIVLTYARKQIDTSYLLFKPFFRSSMLHDITRSMGVQNAQRRLASHRHIGSPKLMLRISTYDQRNHQSR